MPHVSLQRFICFRNKFCEVNNHKDGNAFIYIITQQGIKSFLYILVVDYLQEGECAQSCIKDDVPMDWDATDKTGILNELNQCREDLQQNSKSSILQDFPETVLNKRYNQIL